MLVFQHCIVCELAQLLGQLETMGKKKKNAGFSVPKQGEGKNSKMAQKMLANKDDSNVLVDNTPWGEKKDVSGEMPKAYDPDYVEAAWYKKKNIFIFQNEKLSMKVKKTLKIFTTL